MSDFLRQMKKSLDKGNLSDLHEIKKMNQIHKMVETKDYKKGELEKLEKNKIPLTQEEIEVKKLESIDSFEVKVNDEELKLRKFASILNNKLAYIKAKEEVVHLEKLVNEEKESFISEFGEEEFNKLKNLNI